MPDSSTLSTTDIGLGLAIIPFLFAFVAFVLRKSDERGVLLLAYAFKLVAAVAYLVYTVDIFAGGDTLYFHELGINGAALVSSDLSQGSFASLLATIFLKPGGSATQNFTQMSILLHVLLFDSLTAASLVLATCGYFGQVLLYKTFIELYPDPRIRPWWRVGILFFPSLTFWSAAMLKDSPGILGLGCLVWGAVHLFIFRRKRLRALLALLYGLYLLLLLRPQTLLPLAVAVVPFILLYSPAPKEGSTETGSGRRRRSRNWPWRVALVMMGPLLLVLVGRVDSKFALSRIPAELSYQSDTFVGLRGIQGQNLATNVNAVGYDGTWSGLIRSAPKAVLYTIARPFPWEVRGSVAIVAGAENLVLDIVILWTVGYAIFHRSVLREAIRSPVLIASVVFVLLFAVGVGIATPNAGALNRYRIPLIPFLVASLTILRYHMILDQERQKVRSRQRFERGRLAAARAQWPGPAR